MHGATLVAWGLACLRYAYASERLQPRGLIPATPPWAFPKAVASRMPACATSCGVSWPECEATQCVSAFMGGCMSRDVMINKDCLCPSLSYDKCPNCSTTAEKIAHAVWLNETCVYNSTWRGLPPNWSDPGKATKTVAIWQAPKDVYYDLPNCARGSCLDSLFALSNATSAKFGVTNWIHLPSFCQNISYSLTCNTTCTTWFDRPGFLPWFNSTCSDVVDWHGLPDNWLDVAELNLRDLRPWAEVVASPGEPGVLNLTCPSPGENLGVFAASNIAMLLLTPILGRRTVVAKLSFGLLGQPRTRSWLYMGPIMAGLQIVANAINAGMIKRTPGYTDLDMSTLVMLWFTRPRLAWLVVLLLLVSPDEAMYLSCTAATLTAEIILQILSAIAMKKVTDFGRQQKFYLVGSVSKMTSAPHGIDAQVMYAGALLWLITFIVALGCILYAVIKVNGAIGKLGRLLGLEAKALARRRNKLQRLREEITANHFKLRQTLLHIKTEYGPEQEVFKADEIRRGIGDPFPLSEEVDATQSTYLAEQITSIYTMAPDNQRRYPETLEAVEEEQLAWAACLQNSLLELLSATQMSNTADRDGPMPGHLTQYELDILPKDRLSPKTELESRASNALRDLDFRSENTMPVRANWVALAVSSRNRKARDWIRTLSYEEKSGANIQRLRAELTTWSAWQTEYKSHCQQLQRHAASARSGWEKVAAESKEDHGAAQLDRLMQARTATLFGMAACWIAQWVFWIGFVRLYSPDAYCPPKLKYMALTWILFSVLGIPLGASA